MELQRSVRIKSVIQSLRRAAAWFGVAVGLAGLKLANAAGNETSSGEKPCAVPAAHAFTNRLGMVFVTLPGTHVQFAIWETRLSDFTAFVEATGHEAGPGMFIAVSNDWQFCADCNWRNPGFDQSPDHPVVGVNWNDARAFCEWLTLDEIKLGRIGSHQRYRLPADREWSQAVGLTLEKGSTPQERLLEARGQFPWGTNWPPPALVANYAPGLEIDPFERTAPVGRFPPNALGIFDLGGNVAEWCEDKWNRVKPFRVLRSAPWNNDCRLCLMSSYRFVNLPETRNDYYGFRVVLASSESAQP